MRLHRWRGIKQEIQSILQKLDLVRAVGLGAAIRFKTLPKGELLRLKLNNHLVMVRAGTVDLWVVGENLRGEFRAIKQYLPVDFDGLIVDAGAFIGGASLSFSEMFPRATVLALEPWPANFEILKNNCESNPRIILEEKALVSELPEGGTVRLYDMTHRETGNSIVEQRLGGDDYQFREVAALTLEKIVNRFGKISVLKMDIEGAEKDIFLGNLDLFSEISIVFVELHDRFVPGCTDSMLKMAQYSDSEIIDFGAEKIMVIHKELL